MWLWIVLLAVGTFLIAVVSLGQVTGSLARKPRRSVYDLEEAIEFVAERLGEDLTATLSYDDVDAVLSAHCDYLAQKGVASPRADDDIGEDLIVVGDDEALAWVLGRLDEVGLAIADESVAAVLEVEQRYYQAIGVIGAPVGDPTQQFGEQKFRE